MTAPTTTADAGLRVALRAADILAPGLPGWRAALPVLRGVEAYAGDGQLPPFPRELLPPNERRRATEVMKLVLASAAAVIARSGVAAADLASVFASSAGDAAIIDRICSALQQPNRPVSPTLFHNSVHNAPSGYWSIGAGCEQPSISVSAHDGSFAAGLLESAAMAASDRRPVLLVAYDCPPSLPIDALRHFVAPCAAALVIGPAGDPTGSSAGVEGAVPLAVTPAPNPDGTPPPALEDPRLERLRAGNPAARALPLLQALARRGHRDDAATTVLLPYLDACDLRVTIEGRAR